MLKNVSQELLCLKWGGINKYLSPNELLSVETVFNAKEKEIVALEDRFVSKFAGKLEKWLFKAPIPVKEPVKAEEPIQSKIEPPASIETQKSGIVEPKAKYKPEIKKDKKKKR